MDCTHIFRRWIPEEVEQLWASPEQNIRLENHTRDRAQEQRSHRSEKESKCTERERERDASTILKIQILLGFFFFYWGYDRHECDPGQENKNRLKKKIM